MIRKILIAIASILFIMIGLDKFFAFLEPPCSLMTDVSPVIWKILGVIEILAGIFIWLPRYTKYVASIFLVLMLFFILYHLMEQTCDIGGAVFMAAILGLIIWQPGFVKTKS